MMHFPKRKSRWLLLLIALVPIQMSAQQEKIIPLSQLFELAIANSKQLKISTAAVDAATAAVKVAQTAQLPNIDLSLSASYIGNATLLNRNFGRPTAIETPHFGNNFAIDASQVLYAGGSISNGIAKAKLEKKLAQINEEKNAQDICFLVAGYYLELYKLRNQREVFLKNIEQTQLLIEQIGSKAAQGMALANDVTRQELLLQTTKLSLIEVENNLRMYNNELVATLGLPSETRILPDTTLLQMDVSKVNRDDLLTTAQSNLPELKKASLDKEIATKQLAIVKGEQMPQLSIVAANHFDGPILIEVPTLNKNLNFWYLGIGIKYNIASLYKSNKKKELANRQLDIAKRGEDLIVENSGIAIENAYIRFVEAFDKLKVFETKGRLATDNYRIINSRYLNQMVLITEILDASNTQLNAELELVNAKLNIIYTYYRLQREIGTLSKR